MNVKELIEKLSEIQDQELEVFCEPYISLDLTVEEKRKLIGNAKKAFEIKEVAYTEFRETNKLWVALITSPYSQNLLSTHSDVMEVEGEQ